jgi:diguanylate cyclase (GGDEF)-like protein
VNKSSHTSKVKVSIQSKLVRIIILVSTVSLLIAAILFTFFQLREYRSSMIENLTSAAKVAAENSQAAIWFENKQDATNILSVIASDPRITIAVIYTKEKLLFASYGLVDEKALNFIKLLTPDDGLYQFELDKAHIYQAITLPDKGKVIGYVYLQATLSSLYQQLRRNILVMTLIGVAVLFLAILLSSRLQKVISEPILKLSRVTSTIRKQKDYSIRIESNEYLEIQQLSDEFNSMLIEIQHRDSDLQRLALYDELTGIPNRTLFVDHFHSAIAHSKRANTQLAVCFLDIDNFKPINDNFGHDVGDKLLIEVAQRITASIREEDTVSRQGGDEFAILLGDIISLEQCQQSIERIYHAVTQPYLIDDDVHKITISSGITLYPTDDGDIDTLIRHADQAMYHAKLAGKHCYRVFNPLHDKRIIQKHHQLSEIENALKTNQLTLFYQPKVNMVTGEVFGVEALIRWLHPVKGLIPPLDFLPVIEGSELETQVGDWVIEQALRQLGEWKSQSINFEVSVNISSHHLQTESFIFQLESALARHPTVDPNLLQLEILESSALGDVRTISKILESCKALGIHIALDDFGTGYSSLTHLRRLPVDVIKIDQSFVRDILDDPSDYAIVNGVIGLADSFNRDVIAEGVETTEHGLLLLISNCTSAQGYGIARPMPPNELLQWYSSYIPNQRWLECGREKRTIKDNRIKLFQLFIERWVDTFEQNILAANENNKNWPMMDYKTSHAVHWMIRAKQEKIFDSRWLNSLKSLYGNVSNIANDLLHKYQMGDIEMAREGLEDLHIAADELTHLLQQYE